MSKTHRFCLALQEHRELKDQLREELLRVLVPLSLRDPETAERLRSDIAEIEARVDRNFGTVWHRRETSLSVESSEILCELAGFVQFLLLRDCEKWMLGESNSESQVAPENNNE